MGFGSVFKKVLPALGAALPLPPPFGKMASAAIGKALGIENLEPGGVEKAIADAQVKDPEILLKLKKIDHDFEMRMKEMGIESVEKLAEIDANDRASARGREIAIRDKLPAILAVGVTAGFFGLLALVCFRDIPASSATVLNIMIGSLGTAWAGIISYYFGSSSGSADKSRTLAVIAEKQ